MAVTLLLLGAAVLVWPSKPPRCRWIPSQLGGFPVERKGFPPGRGIVARRWAIVAGPSRLGSPRWLPRAVADALARGWRWPGGDGAARPGRVRMALAAAVLTAVAVGLLVSWAAGLAAGAVAATGLRLVRRARDAARRQADLAAVTGALHALARDLQAGTRPDDAVAQAADAAPARVAAVLDVVSGALRHPPAACGPTLAPVRRRLRAGWELSAAHGIPLAAVVSALAADVADRAAAAEGRAAQVAGPAVSGYVLSALPVAGLLLGAGMGTDPVAVLTGSALGAALLLAGTVLCCTGLLWADRIVRG